MIAASRKHLSPEEERALVERMTTAILGRLREQGGCLPHDLNADGFTVEEINRHWTMAKAAAEFELRISKR